jgi:hypothetical protein
MFQDKASKARLAKIQATHHSGQKGLQALICTFVSIFIMCILFLFFLEKINDYIFISLTSPCAMF